MQPVLLFKAVLGILVTCLTAAALPHGAKAETSPELSGVLRDLEQWLPGSYDSAPQIEYERSIGTAADDEHDRQFRIFARIDAPQLADVVYYSQLKVGGQNGPIVQQVVFLVEIDEKNRGVKFNGRRIADPENYVDAHLDPEKWKTIKPDPRFGGNCDFFWRRHGALLKGTMNDGTCTMVSRNTNQRMTWHTEWVLGEDDLWVYDNGYYDDGSLVTGRADKAHLKLYKAKNYTCSVMLDGQRAESGSAKKAVTVSDVHNRGGVLKIPMPGKQPPLFARLLHGPMIATNSIVKATKLEIFRQNPDEEATASKVFGVAAEGLPSMINAAYSGSEVECRLKRP